MVRFKEAGMAYEGIPRVHPPPSPRQTKERQSTRATGRSEGRGVDGFGSARRFGIPAKSTKQNL